MKAETEENVLTRIKRDILESITVKRSMLNKGIIAPNGMIFYQVRFKANKGKFEGVRMIDTDMERNMGMDAIVSNIRE